MCGESFFQKISPAPPSQGFEKGMAIAVQNAKSAENTLRFFLCHFRKQGGDNFPLLGEGQCSRSVRTNGIVPRGGSKPPPYNVCR